jgi:hypothetical protein
MMAIGDEPIFALSNTFATSRDMSRKRERLPSARNFLTRPDDFSVLFPYLPIAESALMADYL